MSDKSRDAGPSKADHARLKARCDALESLVLDLLTVTHALAPDLLQARLRRDGAELNRAGVAVMLGKEASLRRRNAVAASVPAPMA